MTLWHLVLLQVKKNQKWRIRSMEIEERLVETTKTMLLYIKSIYCSRRDEWSSSTTLMDDLPFCSTEWIFAIRIVAAMRDAYVRQPTSTPKSNISTIYCIEISITIQYLCMRLEERRTSHPSFQSLSLSSILSTDLFFRDSLHGDWFFHIDEEQIAFGCKERKQ